MTRLAISTEDVSYRKHAHVLDTQMAYIDVGEGDRIVFLHGNPTPSYPWRNTTPPLVAIRTLPGAGLCRHGEFRSSRIVNPGDF